MKTKFGMCCLLFFALLINATTSTASIAIPFITIKGKVTDITGNPLPGVNILLEGNLLGVVTNAEGEYKISTATSTIGFGLYLRARFIGYKFT